MTDTDRPAAWSDLIEALTLLAQRPTDAISPFWCEHDQLHVLADEKTFTAEELARLETLGFNVDSDGGFYSFRFGSA